MIPCSRSESARSKNFLFSVSFADELSFMSQNLMIEKSRCTFFFVEISRRTNFSVLNINHSYHMQDIDLKFSVSNLLFRGRRDQQMDRDNLRLAPQCFEKTETFSIQNRSKKCQK